MWPRTWPDLCDSLSAAASSQHRVIDTPTPAGRPTVQPRALAQTLRAAQSHETVPTTCKSGGPRLPTLLPG